MIIGALDFYCNFSYKILFWIIPVTLIFVNCHKLKCHCTMKKNMKDLFLIRVSISMQVNGRKYLEKVEFFLFFIFLGPV